jgi:Holliday junction DNA helicase RuvA
MIGRLTGRVDSIDDGTAILDVGGVGYLIHGSTRTLGELVQGQTASLRIETQVREDSITLYGFMDVAEQTWFRMLLTVQGVGPKAALSILSVTSPDQLVHAVAAGDRVTLARASGVGAKLASRITSELKDKVTTITMLARGATAGQAIGLTEGTAADAASALINLGYRPAEAASAIAAVQGKLGEDADLATLIRSGLAHLSGTERSV